MSIFNLPGWLEKHRFSGKKYIDLKEEELLRLRTELSRFNPEHPEVSVVIPAWNEENNIYRSLSSLAASNTHYNVEIVVVNNNSTDKTQEVLNALGVRSYLQPIQGTPFARQMGLEKARGKYHLCADSDTFYPPDWIDLMVAPMIEDKGVVGVYGRYSFIPPKGSSRFIMWFYEKVVGIVVLLRKKNREYLNVLGFNMGLRTDVGLRTGGFNVTEVRMFDNALGSDYFVEEAEDGRMAVNLRKEGRLELVRNGKARVFTSSRRLEAEGGIGKAFLNRLKLHSARLKEYFFK